MNLKFLCVTVAPVDETERVQLGEQLQSEGSSWPIEGERIRADQQPCGRMALSLDLSGLGEQQDDAAAEAASALWQFLCRSCDERSIAWDVGHELEPTLGRIGGSSDQHLVAAEMLTAIRIARSLSDLIVDDEFIDPEFSDGDSDAPADSAISVEDDSHEQWTGLLGVDPPFIPFPEME